MTDIFKFEKDFAITVRIDQDISICVNHWYKNLYPKVQPSLIGYTLSYIPQEYNVTLMRVKLFGYKDTYDWMDLHRNGIWV